MNQEVQGTTSATNVENNVTATKKPRGFAALSPERRAEIARSGGKAAQEKGVAHRWDSAKAREAGKKGGESVSRNREHMKEIGKKGGAVMAAKAADTVSSTSEETNLVTDTNE